ncbi:MAG: response regulator transcription factor [Planctomycetota bacterium]|jgi:two-component system alkaline phosphatase synthesis response regulator PhoP
MVPKAKIMVVEDNLDEAKLIKMALEGEGYEAVCAFDGKDALEKLDSAKPDLIVLDVMMPEMDGFAFCEELRDSAEYEDIPVVLLTAVAKHIHESRYPLNGVMRAEAQEYLEKPVKPEELLETISRLLK